ncbi:UPF0481 protein At3g47200-like [Trifolium pratense]|nr:UPF0481 protein At3g47200-like [Trifolium pratense]
MMASHNILEQKFDELQKAEKIARSSKPKIQRVPQHLRDRKKFKQHYSPKLVSIGPIHHGNENLKLGEKYKLVWAAQYIKDYTVCTPQDLHKKIVDNINILKRLFADDVLSLTGVSLEGFSSLDEKLSWMLFVDGCSLLNILLCNADLKDDHDILVTMDVLLLENQLPYLVLKLLWKNDDQHDELIDIMKNFLKYTDWATPENETKSDNSVTPDNNMTLRSVRSRIQACFSVLNKKKEEEEQQQQQQHSVSIQNESELPAHLLDFQRKIILTKSSSKTKGNQDKKSSKKNTEMITYRNIQDLRAVGIKLKSSTTRSPKDIDFREGWFAAKLILPEIVVGDTTMVSFLNLIAYEMCPDFENNYGISSFVAFMDSLIDYPEDVRKLRSEGILLNHLGSDEEVANLFNIISMDLVFDSKTYCQVTEKIHKHYCHKYKTWIALGIHTYFKNPWTFIAFLAAFVALSLTFIQTWFAIDPNESKK